MKKLIILASMTLLASPSFSNSTISDISRNQVKYMDGDVSQVSENDEYEDIKNSETRRQLSYNYTGTEPDSAGKKIYTITNLGIRFGGLIKKDVYDAYKDQITAYGVVLTAKLPEGYTSFVSALEAGATFSSLSDNYNLVSEKDHPALCPKDQLTSDMQDNDYYLFNAYVHIDSTDHYNTTIYGAAYVKIGDKKVYLKENSASAVSLADEYSKNVDVTTNEDLYYTLNDIIMSQSHE